jgi:hypothetical protein
VVLICLQGTIEIINDVHILKEGDKVGASEATLLNMLNISPFNYGLLVQMVYDSGTIFEPLILDIKPEDLRVKFMEVRFLFDQSLLSYFQMMFPVLLLSIFDDTHTKLSDFKPIK